MAEILELPHLVEHDRVSQVQVGGRRIEAGLHAQGLAPGEFASQVVFLDQLVHPPVDDLQIVLLSH